MELSIATLIKIILALVVIVAVIYGVYKAITGGVWSVFGSFGPENSSKLFLSLIGR